MTTLLDASGVSIDFVTPRGRLRAVDSVDLMVKAGETLGLVGESGCGKSTLAKGIVGLEPLSGGRIQFRGKPILYDRQRRATSRRVQLVFQDPDASLNPRMTLADAIGEPLRIHDLVPRSKEEQSVSELLDQVGLDPTLRQRFPHELSGGQKQRVCIARALAVRPELLILDESVSALDVSVQAQIINLLSELKQRLGLAYLFITHDLAVVRQFADRVVVMYLGQVVEEAPISDLFASPQHPYTQALLASVPSIGQRVRHKASLLKGDVPSPLSPPTGCRFHTRCPEVFDRCREEAPSLFPLGMRSARCWLREAAAEARPPTRAD